jgi:hypothetical protein
MLCQEPRGLWKRKDIQGFSRAAFPDRDLKVHVLVPFRVDSHIVAKYMLMVM